MTNELDGRFEQNSNKDNPWTNLSISTIMRSFQAELSSCFLPSSYAGDRGKALALHAKVETW